MKYTIAMLGLAALAGCSVPSAGGGTGGSGGGGSGGNTAVIVPVQVAEDITSATYNPTSNTLSVDAILDGSPLVATYARTPALDVQGYEAYSIKESSTQRSFIGLFKQNARGNLSAGAISDGGQANEILNGGTFTRVSLYTAPTSGLASYVGSYVGVIGYESSLAGVPPVIVQGDAVLNADFDRAVVNGGINNRQYVGQALPGALLPLALRITPITNGEFAGKVEYIGKANGAVGDYAGVFGGLNASDVAGVLVFNPFLGDSYTKETGVFVLPCVQPGTGVPCP